MEANDAINQLENDGNNDSRKNSGEVIGERFVFENRPCECKIDIVHNNGMQQYRIQVKASGCDRIFYAYDSRKRGLVTTDSEYREVLDGNDVLTELCNLRSDITKEPEPLVKYFRKYGFFIPISDQNYAIYDLEELLKVITRLKKMIDLLHELTCDPRKIDFNKLFELVLYYIFSAGYTLDFQYDEESDFNRKIESCSYFYAKLWNNINLGKKEYNIYFLRDIESPMIVKGNEKIELTPSNYDQYKQSKEPEDVKGIIRGSKRFRYDYLLKEKVNILDELGCKLALIDNTETTEDEEEMVQQGVDCEDSQIIKNRIQCLYYITLVEKYNDVGPIADFLYHFNEDVASIIKITSDGTVELEKTIDLNKETSFDNRYKKILIEIAKLVYKRELDWALKDIGPACDTENFRPKWNIPSFLTALYFSLFYFDSEYQEYRICENETCRKWFSVPKSRRNKKYCSQKCANLAAQRRFQMKQIK